MAPKPTCEELEKRVRELEQAGNKRERYVQSLRENEEKYRLLFESAQDAIFVADPETGVLVDANRKAEQLTGYSKKELVGKHQTFIHPSGDADFYRAEFQKSVKENGAKFSEMLLLTKDGRHVPVEINSGGTITLEDKKLHIGIFRDITERKQWEERITLLSQMIDTAPASITIHNTDGRFLFANCATITCHGYDNEAEFLAVNLKDLDVPESQALLEERLRRIAEQGEILFEVSHYRKDGSIFPLEVLAKSTLWNGQPAILSVATDITERKAIQERRERLLVFSRALNKISEAIIFNENPDVILEVSNRVIGEALQVDRILIYDVSFAQNRILSLCEWIGHPHQDITPIKGEYTSLEMFLNAFTEIRDTKRHIESHFEAVNVHFSANGSDRILHDQLNIKSLLWYPFAFDEHGYYLFAINRIFEQRSWSQDELDFLESVANHVSIALMKIRMLESRRRAEEALRESEEQYRHLFTNAVEGILIGQDERIELANPALCAILGYSPDIIISRPFTEFIHPADRAMVLERHRRRIRGETVETNYAFRIIDADGNEKWLQISSSIISWRGSTASLSFLTDITERKRTEESLRASEEKFSKAFKTSPYAITITVAKNGEFIEVNDAFSIISGYSREEALLDSSIGLKIWADIEDRKRVIDELFESGRVDNREFRFRKKNGEMIIGLFSGQFMRLNHQLCVLSSINEITHQKQLEAERERLMLAIEHATEVIVITEPSGTIQYVNPAFEKVTGYTRQDLIGESPRILKSGLQDRLFYEDLWRTITAGKTWKGRMVNKRKDGSLYTEEASISPVFNSAGAIVNYVGVKRDITKEIDFEKRLAHSQRIEAIGALAGGIAHDFNNILFPIVGIAELLLDDLSPHSLEYENAKEILKAGRRGGDLVKQILSFSRQSDHQKIPVRIQQILKEAIKLSRATIPSNIEIRCRIQSDCGMVMADPTQLHQVAMNLITNAYHAVEEAAGTISVQLNEMELKRDDLPDKALQPGLYAMLTISDNGHGIDPSLINRIFEPYFTTKAQGKGTGLGLSVVHGIVAQHGGDIRVHSEVGTGTIFEIYLPLLNDMQVPDTLDKPLILETGTERILLVDDEAPIVSLERMMLERLGYRVTARISSVDALDAFRSNPGRFDLVITDMSMPNMTGDVLAGKIVSIKPGIPVILCTGFSARIDEKKARMEGIKGILMKPVAKSDMAKMVRKVLDEAKAGKVTT